MKDIIVKQLKDVSNEHQINILYACESGSRAWGFPSKDSDYDVRFLYTRPLSWYLSIEGKSDTIVLPINDELDINGWDLKKALTLMRKYNAPLSEWLISPIVYFKDDKFSGEIQSLCKQSFNPIRAHYHYMAQARKFYEIKDSESFSVKAFLYFFRATLSVMWIEKFETQPPMNIFELIEPLGLEKAIMNQTEALIKFKLKCLEKDKIPPDFNLLLNTALKFFNDPKRRAPEKAVEHAPNISFYDQLLFAATTYQIK